MFVDSSRQMQNYWTERAIILRCFGSGITNKLTFYYEKRVRSRGRKLVYIMREFGCLLGASS